MTIIKFMMNRNEYVIFNKQRSIEMSKHIISTKKEAILSLESNIPFSSECIRGHISGQEVVLVTVLVRDPEFERFPIGLSIKIVFEADHSFIKKGEWIKLSDMTSGNTEFTTNASRARKDDLAKTGSMMLNMMSDGTGHILLSMALLDSEKGKDIVKKETT